MFKTFETGGAGRAPELNLEKDDNAHRQEVFASLERIGFRESLDEKIIALLILLEKSSRFNQYSRRIEQGAENVFNLLEERYAKKHPELRLSKEQRANASVAAILHDIGKAGPAEATPEEREMIIKIFAQENIRGEESLLTEKIDGIFEADELEKVIQILEKHGIGGQTTMRDFWNKHAQWTHDILEKYPQGLNRHIRVIAGSHHIDRKVDPYGLLPDEKEIPLPAKVIGTLEEYGEALEGRVLIALDQYEAASVRGELSHEEALNRVRSNIVLHKDDELMNLVLEAVDELGKKGRIFE